jgi:Ca2+-binding RTX toxin-like protein
MPNTHPSVIAAALEAALALPASGAPVLSFAGVQANAVVSGTAGNDALQGPAGAARVTLAGGAGDDSYTVAHHYDILQEAAGGGVDTAIVTGSGFTLPDQVENLVLLSDRGYGGGNALGNRIEGNAYAQVLNGGAGTDLLTGGGGADVFQILEGGGWDVITDFTPGLDRLHLGSGSGIVTGTAALAALRQNGADVDLDLGDGLGVTFLGRSVADFSAGDFMAPPDPTTLTLTFADEFDSLVASADGSNGWRTTYADGARAYLVNGDKQYYSDATVGVDPFRIDGGTLVITAAPGGNALGLPYNSGLITTQGSFSQLYGVFEARLAVPAGAGWWPAFWMLPTAGGWPPELDILESFGNGTAQASFTVHTNLGAVVADASIPVAVPDIAAGYHTYAVSWLPDEIRWILDGVEVASLPTPPDMSQPMHLLVDLAISNLAAVAETTAELRIDYVRAYAYAPETIVAHADTRDSVTSAVSATLPDGMHVLTLVGPGPLTGTGNALDNRLVTTAGAAMLLGLGGNDELVGGIGDDTLDGGTGRDRMLGGAGNDTYVVDSAGEKVIEAAGAGTDLVRSAIGYTLGANLENLTLTGSATLGGSGNALDNQLTANDAGARLAGYGGNDTLLGGTGADWLDGGTGADVMAGGAGNDTYVVDQAGDVVQELAGGGTDGIYSALSLVLGANLEKLVLTGTGDLTGIGNALDNSLFGTAGHNLLRGLDGNDLMDGGAGADTMVGGVGNDTYTVDDIRDVIVEAPGEGTDSVRSTIGYTLSADLENLTLLGTAAIGGMGNALANRLGANAAGSRLSGLGGNDTLTGGAGNDILDGGTGADSMTGDAGDDLYIVESATDRVVEAAGGGNDGVYAAITYALGANLEKLVLTGAAALDGTGNTLDNRLFGNLGANRLEGLAGNDWLDGGGGADTLVGGTGDDTFSFAPGCGADVVSDFGNGRDRINLAAFHARSGGMLVTHAGADTVLTFAIGDSITLHGVAAVTLQGDQIIA